MGNALAARHVLARYAVLVVAVLSTIVATLDNASAQDHVSACGSLRTSEGPFDYRTQNPRIAFIEGNHFQPQVQALIAGVSGPIGAELDYLLTYVPNHHKALLLLITYGERLKWTQAPGLRFPYECWYERAIRWQAQDAVVRMIYAMYLNKRSRTKDALAQLSAAAELAGDNGFTHYNVGLIYLEMRNYELALVQAHKALLLGFDRPALRDGLQAAGKWVEPEPAPPSASASEPEPAATKP